MVNKVGMWLLQHRRYRYPAWGNTVKIRLKVEVVNSVCEADL